MKYEGECFSFTHTINSYITEKKTMTKYNGLGSYHLKRSAFDPRLIYALKRHASVLLTSWLLDRQSNSDQLTNNSIFVIFLCVS